jgi:predicted HicB family RNase H-like nuclease
MAAKPKKRRKPPDASKDEYFQFRLSGPEKQAFTDAAIADGKSLSGWIRDRLRRLARDELQATGKPVPFLT